MEIKDDPVIAEIRRVRHEISAKFDHDLSKLFEYYVELQKQYDEKFPQAETEEACDRKAA